MYFHIVVLAVIVIVALFLNVMIGYTLLFVCLFVLGWLCLVFISTCFCVVLFSMGSWSGSPSPQHHHHHKNNNNLISQPFFAFSSGFPVQYSNIPFKTQIVSEELTKICVELFVSVQKKQTTTRNR